MRFFINGALLVVILFFVLEAAGFGLTQTTQAVSAADIPADMASISAVELATEIQNTTSGKAILFYYSSWCPYCKKQIEVIHEIAKERPDIRILSISGDSDPAALQRFLQQRPHLAFETQLYTGPQDMRQIITGAGGNYNGGIPYNGIIANGKIVGQGLGFTGKEAILQALDAI